MASITPRINKNGEITSYTIKVFRGRDSNGKQLKPYSTSFKPDKGMTDRQRDQAIKAFVVAFENKCKFFGGSYSDNIRLSDFIPVYLETAKISLSPTTYDYYTHRIDSLIIPALGHLRLKDIKPAHIQQFINQLSLIPKETRSGLENELGETLSPSSVRRYLTILQSILKQAIKQGIITDNPAKLERLTLPKAQAPKVEIFTKQEAAKVLECLEKEPLQFQALIQLAIYTGARRGELVALKFSDIDFDNYKITIERTAYKLKGEPTKTKPPKDYETRTITINDSCIQLLKLLRAEKIDAAQKLGSKWINDDWVFTQWNGDIMNPMTPTKQFSKFLEKYGLKHHKFHSLRHTSATLLLYAGVNIKQVQGRLGHSDIETTNKYLHLLEEADIDAVRRLDLLLSPSNEQSEPLLNNQIRMKKIDIK